MSYTEPEAAAGRTNVAVGPDTHRRLSALRDQMAAAAKQRVGYDVTVRLDRVVAMLLDEHDATHAAQEGTAGDQSQG